MTIKFNPERVSEYRLIGYDNKKSIIAEDSDELEGGEIGSSSGNTVLFEIAPVAMDTVISQNVDIAKVDVHYHLPSDTLTRMIKYKCPANYLPFSRVDSSLRFATAVAMFGLKIKESDYFPDVDWNIIKNIALSVQTPGDYLQEQFVGLVDKAKNIYNDKKKRRKK
jgi:Ca-activated chloride channel family protein